MSDLKEAPAVELGNPFEGDYFVGPPPGESDGDPSGAANKTNPWRSPTTRSRQSQLRNKYSQIETQLNTSIQNGESSNSSLTEPIEYRPLHPSQQPTLKSSRTAQYQRRATRRSQTSALESNKFTDNEHLPPSRSRPAINVNDRPVPSANIRFIQPNSPTLGPATIPHAHSSSMPTSLIQPPNNPAVPNLNLRNNLPPAPRFAGGPNFTIYGNGRPQIQDTSNWNQAYLNSIRMANQANRPRILSSSTSTIPAPVPVYPQTQTSSINQINLAVRPQVTNDFTPRAQSVNSPYSDFLRHLASSVPGLDFNNAIRQWQLNPTRPIQVPVPQSADVSALQAQLAKQIDDFISQPAPQSLPQASTSTNNALLNDLINQVFPPANAQAKQRIDYGFGQDLLSQIQQAPQLPLAQQTYQPVRPNPQGPSAEDEMADQDVVADADKDEEYHEVETYADYSPAKLTYGKQHPDPVVETSSLSTVEPPDVNYSLSLPKKVIDNGLLSALQLESVIYACQQHQELLPDGRTRRGFLIGDGAGVGKGRTIAGIIYENFLQGRKRSIWLSVSPDLKHDAERDLKDIGANIQVYYLSKFQYGKKLDKQMIDKKYADKGVMFSTYSGLVSKSQSIRGSLGSRMGQLITWVGPNFDGVVVFDECHRAKNISMSKTAKKLSKAAEFVLEIQQKLPNARIVYASATGASETKHLGYMTRLGIWGLGTPYSTFNEFHDAIEKRGVGAMELVAVDLKMRGAYIARQLSFKTTSFEIRVATLDDEFIRLYDECCDMWAMAFRHFSEADRYYCNDKKMLRTMWCSFWAAHQKFFKYLCISAKVPFVTQIAKQALDNDKCIVIGLQSTGEAKTLEALEEDKNLNEFVSTAKATFESLVDNHFPAPPRSKRGASSESGSNFSIRATATPAKSTGSSSSSTTVDDTWSKDDAVKFFVQDGIVKPTVGKRKRQTRACSSVAKKNQKALDELAKAKNIQNRKSDRSRRAKRRASMRQPQKKSRVKKISDDSSESHASSNGLFDSSTDEENKEDSDDTYSEDEEDDEDDETLTGASEDENLEDKNSKKMAKNVVDDDSDSDIECLGTVQPPPRRNAEIIFLSDDEEEDSSFNNSADNIMMKHRVRLCEMRDEMIARLDALGPRLPSNTLDDLIDRLGGPDKVAEMTGRKGRMVKDADGRVSYDQRKMDKSEMDQLDTMNMQEKDRFMRGEKLIAIISEAASSGISLQADRRVKNTRRRVHITIELPWSADRAIQQFGRTHRSNQVSGPEYVFLISELCGERRFASIVAKRLESLGALTHGDRRATTDSRDLSQFNIVSKFSRVALDLLNRYIDIKQKFSNIQPAYKGGDFYKDAREAYINTGLAKDHGAYLQLESVTLNINVFLNRILGMKVKIQNAVFKLFTDITDRLIQRKKVAGLFDAGILELNSESGKTHCDEPERFSLRTQGGLIKCTLRNVRVERGISWQEALEILENNPSTDKRQGFYMSTNTLTQARMVFLIIREDVDMFRVYKPNTGKNTKLVNFGDMSQTSKKVPDSSAKSVWNMVYEKTDSMCVHLCYFDHCKRIQNKMKCDVGIRHRYYCILSGGILTIWPYLELKAPEATRKIQIVRLRLDDKNRVIGPIIPQDCLAKVRTILHEAEINGITF